MLVLIQVVINDHVEHANGGGSKLFSLSHNIDYPFLSKQKNSSVQSIRREFDLQHTAGNSKDAPLTITNLKIHQYSSLICVESLCRTSLLSSNVQWVFFKRRTLGDQFNISRIVLSEFIDLQSTPSIRVKQRHLGCPREFETKSLICCLAALNLCSAIVECIQSPLSRSIDISLFETKTDMQE